MNYLGKPRWIDSEDEDQPFPVTLPPTREEEETEVPVRFPGRDEFIEYAADFPHPAEDRDSMGEQVLDARPDPLLDEPEWGVAHPAPERKKGDRTLQMRLETSSRE